MGATFTSGLFPPNDSKAIRCHHAVAFRYVSTTRHTGSWAAGGMIK